MENWVDLEKLDVMKFARSIERDCQEGVRWERRKLEWILEELKLAEAKSKAA